VSAVIDALDRLLHSSRNFGGPLGMPIDAASRLKPTTSWVESAEASLQRSSRKPPSGSVKDALLRWQASAGQLARITERDVRMLCGESPVATSLMFVEALRGEPKTLQRRQWIERLANSYFAEWRRMERPELLEQLLRQAATHPSTKSRRLRQWAPEAWNLFSEQTAKWLGRLTIDSRKAPKDVLESWGIDPGSAVGIATVDAALERWAEQFRRISADARPSSITEAAQLYQQLVDTFLPSPVLERASVASAVSDVILWPHIDRSDAVLSHLKQLLVRDDRFGDPRLGRNAANWALMKSGARRRALSWLAKENLLFFFEFVIRADPHGRKEFWLQYIEQVEDFNVALCDEDILRLKGSTRATERLSYSRVTGTNDVSAFLMRFLGAQGLVFVEFSKPGNALYVHKADTFDQLVGGLRPHSGGRDRAFHLQDDLKHSSRIFKQPHHLTTWRTRVTEGLQRLGVRRGGL